MKQNIRDLKYRRNVDFDRISSDISNGAYIRIGKGSGRIVYDLGNGQVVKKAINRKGFAQNEVEFRISQMDDSGLFAKVLSASEGLQFLVMDKADRINNISTVWKYFHVRNNKELYQLRELKDLSFKYNLLLRDLGRAVNWGQINGKPIIVDYGFTQQVRRRYY